MLEDIGNEELIRKGVGSFTKAVGNQGCIKGSVKTDCCYKGTTKILN